MIDDIVRNASNDADATLPAGLLERVSAQLADEFDSVRELAPTAAKRPRARASVLVAIALVVAVALSTGVFAATRDRSPRPAVEVRPTPSTTTAPALSDRATAAALADELLDRATLPPGARVSTTATPSILAGPATSPRAATSVDHHRQFAVPTPAPDVAAYLQNHPSPGTSSGGANGSVTAGNTIAYFVEQPVANITGDLIVFAEIEYSATAIDAATSILRVDAIVIWGPRHPHIPPRDIVVVASRELASNPHRLTTIVVVAPPMVAQLVAAFEKSTVEVGIRHCPAAFGNPDVYTLSFAPSRTARPDVVVSIDDTGCVDAEVRVDGRAAPTLTGGELVAVAKPLFTHG